MMSALCFRLDVLGNSTMLAFPCRQAAFPASVSFQGEQLMIARLLADLGAYQSSIKVACIVFEQCN